MRAIQEDITPPPDSLRAQKSLLLANGGLVDLAVRELQAAGHRVVHHHAQGPRQARGKTDGREAAGRQAGRGGE